MKLHRVKITNVTDDEILVLKFQQPVTDTESIPVAPTLAPGESTTAWCNPVEKIEITTSW